MAQALAGTAAAVPIGTVALPIPMFQRQAP